MSSDISSVEKDVIVIGEAEENLRIDKILANHYKDVQSRSYFQSLISKGYVTVNDEIVKKQFRPQLNDVVVIYFAITKQLNLKPEEIPLDIIYEDTDLIVVNKPAGLVVHPAPGNWSGTFVNALLFHCKSQGKNFSVQGDRPGIVHRLDKETSGVLIAAKNPLTQQRLTELFSSRKVDKEYLAICCGNPGKGVVEASIGRHPFKRKQMSISDKGRHAITEYETLAFDGKLSVVKLKLITGRTHQIRVHMQHLHTPILGDSVYGNLQMNKKYRVSRQLLHARVLELDHPINEKKQIFVANIPEDMNLFLNKLNYSLL